mgnify:CR=1 FL=1
MGDRYDFSGWATRNDLTCSDGRIIRQNAFKDCDGATVPLVWMHSHDDPENVLGHCLLENRPEGVYTYGFFNDTEKGRMAKEQVRHRDIDSLSIWANHLKQSGNSDGSVNVVHGDIKEVSLVLSGANPGAMIDTVMEHSGEVSDDDLIIFSGAELDGEGELVHSDTNSDRNGSSNDSENESSEQGEKEMANENSERTVQDVFDEMTDEQKEAVYFMVGSAVEEAENGAEDEDEEEYEEYEDEGEEGEAEAEQSDFYEDDDMKYNVFDNSMEEKDNVMSHADMEEIFQDAKRCGSLKEAVLAHADGDDDEPEVTYGIRNMDILFPDYKTAGDMPNMITRDMAWVGTVMTGVHHTPFSRIKMINADITADEARALGYFKGNLKKEEVFTLLKRKVDPQTIYKKQKFDRDDLLDIADFNVVAFIKTEMRTMLDEEIARAILVGDGRSPMSEDKISEDHIIPIYNDSTLYSIQVPVNVEHGATGADKAKAFIDECVRARKDYKGSGNPVCYMTEDLLTECLLLEDGINHKLYKSEAEVATAIRASKIVTVPVMENMTDQTKGDLAAIIVNLADYTVGADKGGEINMFDDFDIDYNQQKYLMETRISGALTKPKSALVVSIKEAAE